MEILWGFPAVAGRVFRSSPSNAAHCRMMIGYYAARRLSQSLERSVPRPTVFAATRKRATPPPKPRKVITKKQIKNIEISKSRIKSDLFAKKSISFKYINLLEDFMKNILRDTVGSIKIYEDDLSRQCKIGMHFFRNGDYHNAELWLEKAVRNPTISQEKKVKSIFKS